jgi:hypothetical protein
MKNVFLRPGLRWLGLVVGTVTLIGFTSTSAFAADDINPGLPPAAAPASCTSPDCIRGVPPLGASPLECTDDKCLPGTRPAAASWPNGRVAGPNRHGVSTAAPAASADAGTIGPINCPPPNPQVTTSTSDC